MDNNQNTASNQYSELQDIRSSIAVDKDKKTSKFWIVLLVIAVVILFIGAIVQVYTPKTVKVPETSFIKTNVNNTIPNLKKVTYTGPTPDFPTQFSIYSAKIVVSETDIVKTLSAKYGLLRPNSDANFWVNGDLSLVHDTTTNMYSLTLKDLSNESLPIVNPTQAEEVASAYLKETFPEISLRPLMDQANYFILGFEVEDSSPPSKATAVTIPYTAVLDSENFPVVAEKSNNSLFSITVDGDNTIRVLSFSPQFQQYTKIGVQPPISIQEALTQIQNGVASIISASIIDFNRVQMSDLTAATFTNVTIEYRTDPQSGILYPFYRFAGIATSTSNVTADVNVITPAIKTTPQTR